MFKNHIWEGFYLKKKKEKEKRKKDELQETN